MDEENEEAEPDEDVLSPSVLEEKLYGQLEDQEAKISDFHVEKDPSGKDILTDPVANVNADKNDTFVNQSEGMNSSNAGLQQELTSPGKIETPKNVAQVEEQVLNDPLAKVSYVLNQGPYTQKSADKDTTPSDERNTSPAVENNSKVKQTETDFEPHDSNNLKFTAGKASYHPDPAGSIILPNTQGVTPLFNKMGNSAKTTLNHSGGDQKGNQALSSAGGLDNSVQGSANFQLPELVENVIERLGEQGSKFVSMQLAKHPTVKNVWANAIAQALIKQSAKISQLDSGTKSTGSSSIVSLGPDLTGIKSSNDLMKAKVNAESKTKPSIGITDISPVLNQSKEPTHAMKNINQAWPLPEVSKVENQLTNDTPLSTLHSENLHDNASSRPGAQLTKNKPVNQVNHKDNANSISNGTNHSLPLFLPKNVERLKTSKLENHLKNNTPESTPIRTPKVASQNLQDNTSANLGARLETTKDGANVTNNGASPGRPLFENVEQTGGDHQIDGSEQHLFGHTPVLSPTKNEFVSNEEITNRLEGILNEEQRLDSQQNLTPIINGFVSNKESSSQVGPNHDAKVTNDQPLGIKPMLTPSANEFPSQAYSNQQIDGPFLLNKITKLDPGETKYLQMNLMGDPVAKAEFSDSKGPYASQLQLQEEDDKEASYLERQINDVGQIVSEVLPSLKATVSKVDDGEASYVTGQLTDNPFAKAELAESFARDNNLVKAENMQNAQILASVLREDKHQAGIATQEGKSQHQPRSLSASPQSVTVEGTNTTAILASSSSPYSNQLTNMDETKMEADLEGRMLSNPKTVSDISDVDLAPVRNLEGFDGSYNINKPKSSFMYEMQNEGKVQREGGNEADFMTQYGANPLPATVVRAQKKQQIHIKEKHSSKHKKMKYRTTNAKSSSTSSVPRSPPRAKHVKTSSSYAAQSVKPTKSRSQTGTRESEISPTSVIFGLTTNEMKELEKHLVHGPHFLDGVRENGSLRGMSPETKGYFDAKTEEEQEKPSGASVGYLEVKILDQKKITNKGKASSNHGNEHKVHKRKHVKPSSSLSPARQYKKPNYKSNLKRDLESWEAHTDVLNSDLDQIRDLSPKAQEDISKVIMKDYEGQQRNVKDLESFPFDERDPSYAFERSLKSQEASRLTSQAKKTSEASARHTHGLKRLNIKRKRHKLVKGDAENRQLDRKSEFSEGMQFNDAQISEPIVMKGNKFLNDDVIPVDDVKNVGAQGLILEALRKESEGDLRYTNSVQTLDMSRMKSMFQSAGDTVGIKRNTHGHHHLSHKETHSKGSKISEKRDLEDSKTEFSDGTFRNPDFEKQLSQALMQESQHELSFVGTVQGMDDHGEKKLIHHPVEPVGSRSILQNRFKNALQNLQGNRSPDSGNYGSLKNSQEKLRLFFQNSSNNDDDAVEKQPDVGGKQEWTTSHIKASVFRDLTPEGKVLSSDYKDVGNFGSDAQTQLASVLRSANNGDQRDLQELEKMDSDDEREVENLFQPPPGTLKRSTPDETPVVKTEGAIETIADIPDPGSKEKDINIVVSGDSKKGKNN